MPKKMMKEGLAIAGTGIALGVGASAMTEAGVSAAPMTKMSSKLGMVGSLSAMGGVMRGLDHLQKSTKIKKKY